MIVVAARAVDMTIVMFMAVVMCAMTVMRVILVVVIMTMRMAALGISTAFRVKRRFDSARRATKPLDHRLDDVIGADPQTLPDDLNGQMPVAQMPGQTQKMLSVLRPNFEKWFGRPHDFDNPAIFELECITCPKRYCLWQIQQKAKTANTFHRDAAAMAIVKIEDHGIG